jgi:hypothetical protein
MAATLYTYLGSKLDNEMYLCQQMSRFTLWSSPW